MQTAISVVIPLGPGDDAWIDLLPQLDLAKGSEIILSTGGQELVRDVEVDCGISLLICREGRGRAAQMNAGARLAENSVLWFLHADSRVQPETLEQLDTVLHEPVDALYFFDLKFLDDGPSAMIWNERAVRLRSGLLKIPFGDQGLCLPRELFFQAGGYREDLEYGEDHMFVWKVRQEGYPVIRIAAPLFTSARKYRNDGWLLVTAKHVWLTLKQAFPQRVELLRRQIGRLFQ